jgi:hypothetical protein
MGMNAFRKTSLTAAGFALLVGGLSTIAVGEAQAAAPCAAQNQTAGATRNELAHKRADYNRSKKKVKKAKKTYKRHHTTANKKKVKKAKKARKRALARYKAASTRYRTANAAANRCNASASPTRPATSRDVTTSVNSALVAAGVPANVIAQLQPALGPLGNALAGTPLNRLQGIVDQVAAALAGGVDPGLLTGVINQISEPLTQAGIPAGTIAQAINEALAQVPTDPSQIAADPTGLVDQIVASVEDTLAGTPLAQLNPLLDQIRTSLGDIIGTLIGG